MMLVTILMVRFTHRGPGMCPARKMHDYSLHNVFLSFI